MPWSAKRPSPVTSATRYGREICSTPQQSVTGKPIYPPARPGCLRAATSIGDPESQLLADSALAAANAIADPGRRNTDTFVTLAQQRAQGLYHRFLTDEPDLAALATRLTPTET